MRPSFDLEESRRAAVQQKLRLVVIASQEKKKV
jgi:hypothetical protein